MELSTWAETAYENEEPFIKQLGKARDRLTAQRILFGSDHIAGSRFRVGGKEALARWTNWFRELPDRAKKYGVTFTQEEVDLILGGNAAQCLGLDKQASAQSANPSSGEPM